VRGKLTGNVIISNRGYQPHHAGRENV